jgi:hypothetical protein
MLKKILKNGSNLQYFAPNVGKKRLSFIQRPRENIPHGLAEK